MEYGLKKWSKKWSKIYQYFFSSSWSTFRLLKLYKNWRQISSWWRLKCLRSKHPPWSHHPSKFNSYKACESRDITYFICHVTWEDHAIKGLCHLHKFGLHKYCGSEDMLFLICYVTSHDHLLKGLCAFMGGSPA